MRSSTLAGPTADAAIVRVKETGTSIAMSLDGNGRYCALDPRAGTRLMVAECCRNVSTTGALPVAATNNLNFGNPERPEIMAQLVESIEGMAEACEFFETPITGGNVSLYNETLGEAIFPTPVMGIVGLMKTARPTPIHFPAAGLRRCRNANCGRIQLLVCTAGRSANNCGTPCRWDVWPGTGAPKKISRVLERELTVIARFDEVLQPDRRGRSEEGTC